MLETTAPLADRIRLRFDCDPQRLEVDLDRVSGDVWTQHLVRQNYTGDWSVLPLRSVAGARHPVMMIYADPAATAFEDTPWLARTPYLRAVLARFECPIQTARLMRLAPGAAIHEHCDPDLDAEMWAGMAAGTDAPTGIARIHVPITTNPHVDFRLNGTRVSLQPGEVWYLRLSDPHSVVNAGTTGRVHLVFDCVVNAWLDSALRSA